MLKKLAEKLLSQGRLSKEEYVYILRNCDSPQMEEVFALARSVSKKTFGNGIFLRGLIEFTNICKNDCYYCGIRRSNKSVSRYRLSKEEILECCKTGHALGFKTFVLQGGEDGFFTDEIMTDIVSSIKKNYPDCAVTLSLGERSCESYKALKEAGADRYLLRHETHSEKHYAKLHPSELTLKNRLACLENLKKLGYQTGTGIMVGSPFQTDEMIAEDIEFIYEFKPQMIGIGPFLPHSQTPFAGMPKGSMEKTLALISIFRLMFPKALIPSTTALGTINPTGREKGILAGANVVMPNLSPVRFRKSYELYNDKICTGEESAQCAGCLEKRLESIGYKINYARGDYEK